jgi:hypothetical protein
MRFPVTNNRYGFYGFFGAIALALLANTLMGCASPASADEVGPVAATHVVEAPADLELHVDPDLGIIGLLELPPGEYIADTSEVYVVDDTTTITVEDFHIKICPR